MPHKIFLNEISVGATEVVSLDLQDILRAGVLLTGPPTITEVSGPGGSTDLTIDNEAVTSAQITIKGRPVAAGKGIQFRVRGQKAGKTYQIDVTCGTNGTPAETKTLRCILPVK